MARLPYQDVISPSIRRHIGVGYERRDLGDVLVAKAERLAAEEDAVDLAGEGGRVDDSGSARSSSSGTVRQPTSASVREM